MGGKGAAPSAGAEIGGVAVVAREAHFLARAPDLRSDHLRWGLPPPCPRNRGPVCADTRGGRGNGRRYSWHRTGSNSAACTSIRIFAGGRFGLGHVGEREIVQTSGLFEAKRLHGCFQWACEMYCRTLAYGL